MPPALAGLRSFSSGLKHLLEEQWVALSQQRGPCWRVPVTLPEAGVPRSLLPPLQGCGESTPWAHGRAGDAKRGHLRPPRPRSPCQMA